MFSPQQSHSLHHHLPSSHDKILEFLYISQNKYFVCSLFLNQLRFVLILDLSIHCWDIFATLFLLFYSSPVKEIFLSLLFQIHLNCSKLINHLVTYKVSGINLLFAVYSLCYWRYWWPDWFDQNAAHGMTGSQVIVVLRLKIMVLYLKEIFILLIFAVFYFFLSFWGWNTKGN